MMTTVSYRDAQRQEGCFLTAILKKLKYSLSSKKVNVVFPQREVCKLKEFLLVHVYESENPFENPQSTNSQRSHAGVFCK